DELLEMLKGRVKGSSGEDELLEMLKGRVKGSSGEDELLEMLKPSSKDTSPLEDLLQEFVSNQEDALQLDKSLARFFSFFIQNLEHAEEQDFLDQFKNCLEILGVDIEDISVDEQGLDILKHLLVKAGFPEKEISDLFEELQLESEDSFVALSDLMTELSKIEIPQSVKDEAIFLPVSSLPFIETILTALNVPADVSNQIITPAARKREGIDLNTLITGLQNLQKQAFLTGTDFRTASEQKGVKGLLTRLGLDISGSEQKELTLEEFTAALENLRKDFKQSREEQALTSKEQPLTSEITSVSGKSKTELFTAFLFSLNKNDAAGTSDKTDVLPVGEGKTPAETATFELQRMSRENQNRISDLFADQNDLKINEKNFLNQENSSKKEIELLLSRLGISEKGGQKGNPSGLQGKEGDAYLSGNHKKADIKSLDAGQLAGGSSNESDLSQGGSKILKGRSAPKPLPAYVTNQVEKNLARAVDRGDSELKLQLKPPELGRIIVKIENLGDSLKVNIITENHAAKDILVSHANELKTNLSGSGVDLKSFEVEMGSDFKQSMADARQQSGHSGSGRGKKRGIDLINETETKASINIQEDKNQDGQLHYVA
ncbi:MAG: flagellar hook-length control protein FliK, partial [Thermodesulfobacteriota bacterium]|nr:flagellar hook-length control protein FliK [Thermodesulfobacteriota bacterium]